MLNSLAFYTGLFLISWVLTFFLYRYAKSLQLIAAADERSSHEGDTATGGGLALASTFILATWLGCQYQFISYDLFIAIAGGGGLLAIIGFWDDIKPLPIRVRMMSQTIAALWAIYWVGSLPTLTIGHWQFSLGNASAAVTFLAIIWFINLYNFMDGIDGLAGTQATTIAISAALLAIFNQQPHQSWLYAALGVILIGFLFWNWPSARIFMGDTGSCFLGYLFAVLTLRSSQTTPHDFWVFTILLSIFLVDATLTLLRRLVRGEPFYQPHCTHSYQILAQRWQSHKKVTLFVLGINLFWLLPWAFIANIYPHLAFESALVALFPILTGCIYLQIKHTYLT
jgi:Fuc2NAc and GlcNAc transferase